MPRCNTVMTRIELRKIDGMTRMWTLPSISQHFDKWYDNSDAALQVCPLTVTPVTVTQYRACLLHWHFPDVPFGNLSNKNVWLEWHNSKKPASQSDILCLFPRVSRVTVRAHRVLKKSRVRNPVSKGNQVHCRTLWTLGFPKMYMVTLGYKGKASLL